MNSGTESQGLAGAKAIGEHATASLLSFSWKNRYNLQRKKEGKIMNFKDFSVLNRRRCEAPHGFNHKLSGWSTSEWMVAILGELGEAANIIKKLNRVRDGIPGNTETPEQLKAMLAEELANVFIYLDLTCQAHGLSLEDIVVTKFQKTSKKIGYDDFLEYVMANYD